MNYYEQETNVSKSLSGRSRGCLVDTSERLLVPMHAGTEDLMKI